MFIQTQGELLERSIVYAGSAVFAMSILGVRVATRYVALLPEVRVVSMHDRCRRFPPLLTCCVHMTSSSSLRGGR
jgi:hypothetical protein